MRYLDFASSTSNTCDVQWERLVVAIDTSGSMDFDDWKPTRLEAAKEATAALIEQKRRIAPEDEVAIVTFDNEAQVICPPVAVNSGAQLLSQTIGTIQSGGCTNMRAALTVSQGLLQASGRRSFLDRWLPDASIKNEERRLRIILLTDGGHNEGRSPKSIATKLKNADVCIDCIGIGGDPSAVDEDLLKTIASKHADGKTPCYVFIGDKCELIQKFEQLAGRIAR